MRAYYNEIDLYCAEWLCNLIREGHIADGDVDTRRIEDVVPTDLNSYTQCHFFAGIGGWSRALRLAGIPDGQPVWTGSCPCQPFSTAGRAGGFDDERHLWPHWHYLIRVCCPAIVLGEQVVSPAGLAWLDLVWSDLEGEDYAVGAADLGAACVGAPHIRQRLWFVAHASERPGERRTGTIPGTQAQVDSEGQPNRRVADRPSNGSEVGSMGLPASESWRLPDGTWAAGAEIVGAGEARVVGNAEGQGWRPSTGNEFASTGITTAGFAPPTSKTFWSAADWVPCSDGKSRPVEPGTFPLAHGVPARVGKLRAYGNAIVPQVAAEFIGVAL